MRNFINLTVIATIICAASLTTSSSANAWDNGGSDYDNASYRDWTYRYWGKPDLTFYKGLRTENILHRPCGSVTFFCLFELLR